MCVCVHADDNRAEKGLRLFSLKVCEVVERQQVTTYKKVADELVAELGVSSSSSASSAPVAPGSGSSTASRRSSSVGGGPDGTFYREDNIKRRVYDVLNVLEAVDVISKDFSAYSSLALTGPGATSASSKSSKDVAWIGLPEHVEDSIRATTTRALECAQRLKTKRLALQNLLVQQVCLHNLREHNARRECILEQQQRMYEQQIKQQEQLQQQQALASAQSAAAIAAAVAQAAVAASAASASAAPAPIPAPAPTPTATVSVPANLPSAAAVKLEAVTAPVVPAARMAPTTPMKPCLPPFAPHFSSPIRSSPGGGGGAGAAGASAAAHMSSRYAQLLLSPSLRSPLKRSPLKPHHPRTSSSSSPAASATAAAATSSSAAAFAKHKKALMANILSASSTSSPLKVAPAAPVASIVQAQQQQPQQPPPLPTPLLSPPPACSPSIPTPFRVFYTHAENVVDIEQSDDCEELALHVRSVPSLLIHSPSVACSLLGRLHSRFDSCCSFSLSDAVLVCAAALHRLRCMNSGRCCVRSISTTSTHGSEIRSVAWPGEL